MSLPRCSCGVNMSFEEQGMEKKKFDELKEDIAYLAYEDQCSPCNPRLPIIVDMVEILNKAFYQ